jgi:HAD superfamily hydrolase (TIGR01490 family)
MTRLTLFDLDHTLIDTDSNQAWIRFLIAEGLLDASSYAQQSAQMEKRYRESSEGIDLGFCEFFIGTLTLLSWAQLATLLPQFLHQEITPRVNPGSFALIHEHRQRGDALAIITATNRIITTPIAAWFGIDDLIATEPELSDGRPNGRVQGTPSMREGKVLRLDAWLASGHLPDVLARSDLEALTFYSDSINDLPLLSCATTPVAVNPDPALQRHAVERGWLVRRL